MTRRRRTESWQNEVNFVGPGQAGRFGSDRVSAPPEDERVALAPVERIALASVERIALASVERVAEPERERKRQLQD